MCEKSTSSILVFSEYFATRVGSSNITQPHFPSDEITGGWGGGDFSLFNCNDTLNENYHFQTPLGGSSAGLEQ